MSLGAGIALAALFISGASLMIFTFKAYLSRDKTDYISSEVFKTEIKNLRTLTEQQNKELNARWDRLEQHLTKINDVLSIYEKRISKLEAEVFK